MSTKDTQFAYNDPKKPVHHVLSFRDELEGGLGIKTFESFAPFQPVSKGDFINTQGWGLNFDGQGLTVIRVSHKIWEDADAIYQETFVYCRWFDESAHGQSSVA